MRDTYDAAMVKAVALANRTNRPADIQRNAFGGYSVGLIMLGGDGLPVGSVGQIVRPGDPLTEKQEEIRRGE